MDNQKENYYKVLNVSENATPDEIKKSYRQLSFKYHPDKNQGSAEATAKFQQINEAYETLSDPEKKQQYDMTRNNPFSNFNGGGGINANDLNNIFANMFNPFQNHMGGINMGGMNMGGMNMGGMNIPGMPGIRIFTNGNMFGQNKPPPIQHHLTISIEQVLVGTTIPIEIERFIIEGQTKSLEKETLYIPVPKGIDNGEIIILQDKGNIINHNINNMPIMKGDVKIFIEVQNKTEFKRQGLDLIYEKKIGLKDALCGFTFEIKHINGKMYTINNNIGSIISPNYKKLVPNLGLSRDNHTGNLIIQFEVQFPEKLSEETVKKLLEIL